MSCRIVKSVCKTAGETKPWGFDYAGFDADAGTWAFLVRTWSPGVAFADEVCVRPTVPTGLQYRSAGGFAGAVEPRWPRTVGGTITDGSIIWTAEAVSDESLNATIATSAWAADDSDITLDDDVLTNTGGVQQATVQVGGGVANGEYEVLNRITLSDGSVEDSILKVKVV